MLFSRASLLPRRRALLFSMRLFNGNAGDFPGLGDDILADIPQSYRGGAARNAYATASRNFTFYYASHDDIRHQMRCNKARTYRRVIM